MAPGDLRLVIRFVSLSIFSWLVPEAAWRPFRRRIELLRARLLPSSRIIQVRRARHSIMQNLMGRELTAREIDLVDYEVGAGNFTDTLQIFRSYRPGGWNPRMTLTGEEHVLAGLERGHGILLWVGMFRGNRLVPKMALSAAGYSLHHLSRQTHGFAASPFSVRYLNPYWIRIENQFLAERIVLTEDNMIRVMKTLKKRLEDNKLVSITDAKSARQHITVPFLGGYRSFASGPANLALRTGADLLPVFCLELGARDFEVVIEPPLTRLPGELTIEGIVGRYSESLGAVVSAHPELWLGWDNMAEQPRQEHGT
jgi:lauroyl/myristoyl acyltransferase